MLISLSIHGRGVSTYINIHPVRFRWYLVYFLTSFKVRNSFTVAIRLTDLEEYAALDLTGWFKPMLFKNNSDTVLSINWPNILNKKYLTLVLDMLDRCSLLYDCLFIVWLHAYSEISQPLGWGVFKSGRHRSTHYCK